jgi:hypothetical protein
MRSYRKKSSKNRTKKYYKMKGCSKKSNCLGGRIGGGSNGIITRNLYPNKGPPGPYPGWLSSQTGGCLQQCGLQQGGQKGGNNGLPYGQHLAPMKAPVVPNGLTGNAWGADFKWPGSNGISGDFNHISYNKYIPDVVTAIKNVGANFPFFKGGKSRKNIINKNKYKKGGSFFANSLAQDAVNYFRVGSYNSSNLYNAVTGQNNTAVNPLPQNQPSLIRKY